MVDAKITDWKTKQLPENRKYVPLNRLFTGEDIKKIKTGLIPEVMEDKWFVYWESSTLFFYRSWTGYCIYQVEFKRIEKGEYKAIRSAVNTDPEQYQFGNDDHERQMIFYLIDTLLLDTFVPFPGENLDPVNQMVKEWSSVGRTSLNVKGK